MTVAALMLLSGCSAGLTDEPQLVSDVEGLQASAEFTEGSDDNVRTLTIRSNRSWYAHLNNVNNPVPVTENVEWGQIDICEHFNLTGVMDEVQVTVSFNRNYSQTPVNGVLNFYSEKQLFMSIPVCQEGAVYRLVTQPDRTDVTCGEDCININVDCNTAWTAEILAGGTADAALSASEGFDAGSLQVRFAENFDPSQEKTVTVRFRAESCPDQDITFVQSKAVPYIRLHESTRTNLKGTDTEGMLSFYTNCPWRAEVTGGNLTLSDLSKTEGESGVNGTQEITFKVTNNGTDVETLSKASVRIIPQTDELEPLSVEFSQRPGLVIDFRLNPFRPEIVADKSLAAEVQQTELVCGEKQYDMSYYLSYFRSATQGLAFVSDGYISLPVVPGLTLESMEFFILGHKNLNRIRARVMDAAGNFYSSKYDATFESGVDYRYLLPLGEALPGDSSSVLPTEKDGIYMLKSVASGNCLLQKLVLYYE